VHRACDPQPEYYLIADDLVGSLAGRYGRRQTDYTVIGRAALPNGKGLTIYQVSTGAILGNLPVDALLCLRRQRHAGRFARSA
jgi:hypothetical protein